MFTPCNIINFSIRRGQASISACSSGSFQQFCDIHAQHLSQPVNDIDARVVNVAFQRTDIGAIDASLMRKLFL